MAASFLFFNWEGNMGNVSPRREAHQVVMTRALAAGFKKDEVRVTDQTGSCGWIVAVAIGGGGEPLRHNGEEIQEKYRPVVGEP
jgi:hypothetical protein